MADPKGFLTTPRRELPTRRPVDVRILDWREVYEQQESGQLQRQAGRCMDCGIPFCHDGCPLGNLIPEWNDLVWRDEWQPAIERLHATRTDGTAAVVLNPGALTHYSYALRDAVTLLDVPVVEVHLSQTAAREPFRHHSVISAVVDVTITGAGAYGYELAVLAARRLAAARRA